MSAGTAGRPCWTGGLSFQGHHACASRVPISVRWHHQWWEKLGPAHVAPDLVQAILGNPHIIGLVPFAKETFDWNLSVSTRSLKGRDLIR